MEQRDVAALARKLRVLRLDRWPDRRLTQQDVADALGVALSSVSSWESTKSVKVPPALRIADYATLFSTPRSVDGARPRLLREDELTDAERAERERLAAELEQLRTVAVGDDSESTADAAPRSLWHFPDGGPVRIICGHMRDRSPYASARNHNYMQLTAYKDIDALVELFGHVRAENPESNVGFDLATRLESEDLRSHLVLLGSAASNEAVQRVARLIDLPFRQVTEPEIENGEVFELKDSSSTRFRPELVDDGGMLLEDVGMFFRTPNPYNISRTLTLCSGVFTRGVYGAVSFLTDSELRDKNNKVLDDLFAGASTFGLLMRVPILDHATGTPDLRRAKTILYEWSEAAD
jgi:transcriptional regulator with XRE-family HTH domain